MTRIKICGITRIEDALAAVRSGAHYLGFIFAESPRKVTPERVRLIVSQLPDDVETVGVFANEEPERINRLAEAAGLTMVQFHGDEAPEARAAVVLPVIKAVRLRRGDEEALRVATTYPAEYVLIEPYVEGRLGGTGKAADWKLARELVLDHPERRFFLAGGLGPDNVAEAIRAVGPYAVDASSGLEERPGIKDPAKISIFAEVVRSL